MKKTRLTDWIKSEFNPPYPNGKTAQGWINGGEYPGLKLTKLGRLWYVEETDLRRKIHEFLA